MTIAPIFTYLSFGIQLHPKTEKVLCLSHGVLSYLDDSFSNLFCPAGNLYLIMHPRHVLKVFPVVESLGYEVFFE